MYYQLRCPLGQNQQLRKKGWTSKYTACINSLVCSQIQGNIKGRQDADNINTVVAGTAYRHSGCQETAVHWLDRRNRLAFSHVSEGVQEHYARNGGKGGCHS